MFDKTAYQKDYQRQRYPEKAEIIRAQVYRRRMKLRALKRANILEYLKTHPCVDCGERDPIVLQFDHVRGKKKHSVSAIVEGGHSWKTVLTEIAKCDIRCANCHIRKTAREQKNYKFMDLSSKCIGHQSTKLSIGVGLPVGPPDGDVA